MLLSIVPGATRRAPATAQVGGYSWYYGWTVLAVAVFSVCMAQGTRAAYGVLLVALVDEFGWGRGLAAGPLALGALLWAASAPFWGAALDRWGPRRVWATAAVAFGLGLAIAAATEELWQLYLGVGLVAGTASAPFLPNSQGVVVANWFARRRGLAMAATASGVGLGVLLLPSLTQSLVGQAGWRIALLALAALFVLGVAPAIAVLQRFRPDDPGTAMDGARAAPARMDGPTLRFALRQGRFWMLTVGILLATTPYQLLLVHGLPSLVDAGIAPALAAGALGLAGACGVAGVFFWGYVADRWGAEWVYTGGCSAILGCLALLLVATPTRPLLLLAYAGLFALSLSAILGGATGFMGAALCQGRSLGALMGVVSAHVALANALGPTLGGWAYDLTGSYTPAFGVAALCAVGAVVCVWHAAPRRGVLRPAAAGLV